ncbi:MAG: alcohol dehydrogenase [Herpetosiphonaceae bacterium]|nr:MAG: alcohol dehydrogenase [Herpetosiphonaceae bacterium]
MRALIFDGQLRLATNYPEPVPRPGEALIRPHLAGICATDREIARGYMNFRGALGHEFVGTVVESDDERWVGRRVVGEINAACGACPTCRRGEGSHCPHRTTLGIDRRDGAMAELLALPVANLHLVPESVADRAAVFTEPLAAALQILELAHVRPTERAVVVGDGKLGILVAQVLRLMGCAVHLIGRHPERWDWIEALGIKTGDGSDLADRSVDVVVDCTGNPGGLETARRLIRPRGRLMLKSTFHGSVEMNLTPFVVDEIAVLTSRCGPFEPALRVLERRLVETERLIEAVYPLDQAEDAFEAARGRLKILLAIA